MIKTRKRKSRSDRKHLIYSISIGNQEYIGITYVENSAVNKSLTRRWQKHVRRALKENKNWNLCIAIRKYGPDAFNISVLDVVRGKSAAHKLERELIHKRKPKLNTDVR